MKYKTYKQWRDKSPVMASICKTHFTITMKRFSKIMLMLSREGNANELFKMLLDQYLEDLGDSVKDDVDRFELIKSISFNK